MNQIKTSDIKNKLVFVGIAAFLGIMFLNPVTVIETGEVGLVKTFGVIQDRVLQPGINFRKPFVDEVMIFNTKNQAVADGKGNFIESSAYTKDNQPITVKYDIIYNQPSATLKQIYSKYGRDVVSNNIYSYVETAFKTVLGQYTASQLITEREEVRQKVLAKAREYVVDSDLNIPIVNIQNIPITDIQFDASYTEALKNKQVELEKARQKVYELQSAQREAQITVTKANAEAESIKIRSNALKNSPNLVQLEAVKKWNGEMPATYITGGHPNTFLPLK
ncbi:MAG: prohibitin family protein [bacterium]